MSSQRRLLTRSCLSNVSLPETLGPLGSPEYPDQDHPRMTEFSLHLDSSYDQNFLV